jgi:hypothetical protein
MKESKLTGRILCMKTNIHERIQYVKPCCKCIDFEIEGSILGQSGQLDDQPENNTDTDPNFWTK